VINIDELERHAKAYLPDENRRAHPAHIQAYYGHCGPEAMIALVRIARAAIKVSDFSIHSAFDELKEAIDGVVE
jgi:hypothetical protein